MKETKITCDQCLTDLTTTGPNPAYRLSLSAERLPSDSDIQHSILVYPPFTRDKHFCNMSCLQKHFSFGDAND